MDLSCVRPDDRYRPAFKLTLSNDLGDDRIPISISRTSHCIYDSIYNGVVCTKWGLAVGVTQAIKMYEPGYPLVRNLGALLF